MTDLREISETGYATIGSPDGDLRPNTCSGPARTMDTLVVGEKADQSCSNMSTVRTVDEVLSGHADESLIDYITKRVATHHELICLEDLTKSKLKDSHPLSKFMVTTSLRELI